MLTGLSKPEMGNSFDFEGSMVLVATTLPLYITKAAKDTELTEEHGCVAKRCDFINK